jgi:hypothetical protein
MLGRLILTVLLCGLPVVAYSDVPRTSDGKPDLTGTYDIATITPVERPKELGNALTMSRDQAQGATARMAALQAATNQASDPDRGAPPAGGDGSGGPAGNVGGYNTFWIDAGERPFMLDGEYRTSIIVDPPDGRLPSMTTGGKSRRGKLLGDVLHVNEGEAWWLGRSEEGPYDNPESLTLSDRCITGFGSTGGPPMLPTAYNNLHRIVQTPEHVMILVEMVHDARIVRLDSEHVDSSVRKWLGDSIGWWEGDTLVVDTTNFTDQPAQWSATRDLHVIERFRRIDENTLHYSFTVTDPNTWDESWSGEYPWPQTDARVYEYACHEGNYAMEGILKGARLLEREALAEVGPGDD